MAIVACEVGALRMETAVVPAFQAMSRYGLPARSIPGTFGAVAWAGSPCRLMGQRPGTTPEARPNGKEMLMKRTVVLSALCLLLLCIVGCSRPLPRTLELARMIPCACFADSSGVSSSSNAFAGGELYRARLHDTGEELFFWFQFDQPHVLNAAAEACSPDLPWAPGEVQAQFAEWEP